MSARSEARPPRTRPPKPPSASSIAFSPARPSVRSIASNASFASSSSRPSPGRGDQLKEYVIGVQVFDKETSFDPRADPIVRVQARRLRARLVRYYRDDGRADDARRSSCRRAATAPVFKRRDASAAKRSISSTLLHATRSSCCRSPITAPTAACGYFCDGLRQEIIHALASLESLRVLVWHPAEPAQAADSRQAVNAMHAAMVVTGSVRTVG